MTDLRCAKRIHLKALGPIIELKCRDCANRVSGPTRRVTVYHRWEYDAAKGFWTELNDRTTVQESTVAIEPAVAVDPDITVEDAA